MLKSYFIVLPTGFVHSVCVLFLSLFFVDHSAAEQLGLTTTSVVKENLFLAGTFDDYTANQVIRVLEQSPQVRRVVLTANGGSVNDRETLRLGRYIRDNGLDTHLIANGVVASGGVSLLLSGVNRSVGANSFIGVHAWAECSEDKEVRSCRPATAFNRQSKSHDLHRDYTIEMLGDDAFYWFSIQAAPHNSIYWLSAAELQDFNVVNVRFDDVLTVPFKDTFKQEYESTCHNCPHP